MFPKEYGLSIVEAESILKKVGKNVLPEQPSPNHLSILISQVKNPLVYVLLIAGVITLLLNHIPDSLIIFSSILINTILGYFQETKANRAHIALKKLVVLNAETIREGKRFKINASEIVPGDLVVLNQGFKIPADGELIFANRIYFDEAIITGESIPVSKQKDDSVFMGTTVLTGQGLMRVSKTGVHTRIGGIAQKIQEIKEETPLGRQLRNFSKKLLVLIICLTIFVFVFGIFQGRSMVEMFTTAVALAVSSIPEGLLVSLTVVLAIGMQKILKRKGLVRKLASAETLGGVTTICIDKTGTLTQGKMQVVDFWGNKDEIAKQAILANDLDDPIVIAAFDWGRQILKDFPNENIRFDSIPFSSKERFFISLHPWKDEAPRVDTHGIFSALRQSEIPPKQNSSHSSTVLQPWFSAKADKTNMIFVNGAPDVLLQWSNVSKDEKDKIEERISRLTSEGKRLIGFARKEVSEDKKTLKIDDAKNNLEWIGLLALSDPVRPLVKEALQKATGAGINIIVITGDYPNNSRFVLGEIGIPVSDKEIMTGVDIEKITTEELSLKVKTIKLFARTTPDQKYKIVEALKKNNEIVAMMGDGVNDAPAMHAADIGIVVNEASDVARESADLILLDSDFSTIISAIEEGRGMFDNIRKIILYLLSDAFAEIIVVVGSIILNLPLPITAVQIIWINLVSDGFPDLALTIDPKRKGIMNEKPRLPSENLVSRWMVSLIGAVSIIAGTIALLVFIITYRISGDIILARSMAFITLGLNSFSYVFSVRSLMVPFRENNLFKNKWLLLAVAAGLCLQVLPFLTSSLRQFFGIASLSISYWLVALSLSVLLFFIVEIFKMVYRLNSVVTSLGIEPRLPG